MKVLLVGADGQLGRELRASVPLDVELVARNRTGLDICDGVAVAATVATEKPDVVINAAAYTAVDRAESEPERAFAINETGAANLARAAASQGSRLIHVSTDFVFNGAASQPYTPQAEVAGLGVYGRSKLAGEQRVREASGDRALILRTAWVYSCFGHNFVKTMLRLMTQRPSVSVVSDQLGSPTWASGLALLIWRSLQHEELQGRWHWTDSGTISWYDFARAIAEEGLSCGLLDRPVEVLPISSSEFQTAAQRPSYSALDSSATVTALGIAQHDWREQLRAMLLELKEKGGEYFE
ncbi:MAG: dTDP-4-dehydrorhamnose reductase [Halieaceae bacterium]|jgi:dTDP-4-dehydrorhamnose reductase